jgi:hypothetical protein
MGSRFHRCVAAERKSPARRNTPVQSPAAIILAAPTVSSCDAVMMPTRLQRNGGEPNGKIDIKRVGEALLLTD